MREKVRAAHPVQPGASTSSTARGGMIDVEFAVQYLVLAHARAHPDLDDNVGNIALLRIAPSSGCCRRARRARPRRLPRRIGARSTGCGWKVIARRASSRVATDAERRHAQASWMWCSAERRPIRTTGTIGPPSRPPRYNILPAIDKDMPRMNSSKRPRGAAIAHLVRERDHRRRLRLHRQLLHRRAGQHQGPHRRRRRQLRATAARLKRHGIRCST